MENNQYYNSKLFIRISFLAIPALIGMLLIVRYLENLAGIMAASALLVVALILCAAFLAFDFLKKAKIASFDHGMQVVMDCVPIVCSLYDKDNNILYCNDKAPLLFGYKNREEYCKNYATSFPEIQPDGRRTEDVVNWIVSNVMKDDKVTIEWCQKNAAGDLIPLELSLVRTFYRGEYHLLEFTEDMRIEQEIESKREDAVKDRMKVLLDSTPLLCAIFDEEGKVMEVNKEAETMFNIPDKQIFIDNYEDFLPKNQMDGTDSFQKSMDMLNKVMKEGFYRYEFLYQRRDGTKIPTEEIATRIKLDGKNLVICYSRDLREYYAGREAEQAAQKKVTEMMERLNHQLETQASSVTESSAAIEEMIANIRSVSNTLSKNAENVKELQEAAGVGHAGLNDVALDIGEIAKESESLLEINSVMQNIASQTNLLSMNAAIEAAHAGESGRGFAVVADEIRKLAESSSKQSKTISAALKKIKGSIDKITRSTDNVMSKFNAIDSGVKIVADQESNILNAMTEQGEGSAQIMQAISQLNDITSQVKTDATHMIEAASKLGS